MRRKRLFQTLALFLLLFVTPAVAQQTNFGHFRVKSRGFFSKPFRLPIDESISNLKDGLLLDLDDDGDLDMLGVSDLGVFVRRGEEVPERFGPLEIRVDTKGAKSLMAAEEPGLFWLRWEDRDVADLVSWKGKQWSIVRSEDIGDEEFWALWEGWFVHGPDAGGRLVASNGEDVVVLSEDLAELKRLEVLDLEGDGEDDLVLTLANENVGWIHSVPAANVSIEWISGMSDFGGRWTPVPTEDERVHLYGNAGDQVVEVIRNGRGDWTEKLTDLPPHILSRFENWRHRLDFDGWLLFSHHEISHGSEVILLSKSGDIKIANASEAPMVQSVQVLDFNGDGLQDVAYLDVEEHEWVAVLCLDAADEQAPEVDVAAWPWASVYPNGVDVAVGGKLPFWDGINQTNYLDLRDQTSDGQRIRHLLIQGRAIHGQLDDASFRLRRSDVLLGYENRLSRQKEAPEQAQLYLTDLGEVGINWPHVQHLPEKEMGVFSYFAKVTLDEWHHFVFTRDENLGVKGYVDGQLVMSGYSTDVRFDHRRILLGASYGTNWNSFFRGRLDEVEFSNKVFTDEEVRSRFEARALVTDPWTQASISFEPTNGRVMELIGGQEVRFEGGWRFVDGVSGQAVRFNGIDGRGHVYSDLAEKNMSVSYWAFIEKDPNPQEMRNRPRSILSAYGMYNNNYAFGDVLAAQPPAEVVKGLDFERLAWPEGKKGRRFSRDGNAYFLSSNGEVYVLTNSDWRLVKTSGNGPSSGDRTACAWVETDEMHWITGEGAHHVLDWETLTWHHEGRVNSQVADQLAGALRTQAGVAFVGREGNDLKGWWKPESKSELVSLVSPKGEADAWVGLESHWGILYWVSADGMMQRATLDEESKPISFYNGFQGVWAGLALAALVLLGIWRKNLARQPERSLAEAGEWLPDEEFQQILERLRSSAPAILDTHELDGLLGLSDVESLETRRSHRARLIRQCNAWSESKMGKLMIVRKKDPTDRRRTLYSIKIGQN